MMITMLMMLLLSKAGSFFFSNPKRVTENCTLLYKKKFLHVSFLHVSALTTTAEPMLIPGNIECTGPPMPYSPKCYGFMCY